MMRNVISVIAGLATAIITFLLVESLNNSLHPVPNNLDFKDPLAVKTFYEQQPVTLWLLVLLGWAMGSFFCGLLIQLIGKNPNKKLPIIAGSILTVSAIANFVLLPHPIWCIVVGLLIFIPSTIIGHQLMKTNNHVK
ncbi:MAG: hypothetical protein MUE72_07880 [Chitinophagaceae bacterium]|jgi:hypothetical protein|nr:hypothetical protein [Chitinophagaceae bacterium]